MNIDKVLLGTIASEICGRDFDVNSILSLSSEELKKLYDLALMHDVAHIVGSAISKSGAALSDKDGAELFSKEHMLAVFRYRRFSDELSNISTLFENEALSHIILKGSVLRDYYPEPWMRTSCDIDILVKPDDVERAGELLEKSLGYTLTARTRHDVSYNSATGVHLELHYTLIEDGVVGSEEKILGEVWEHTVLLDEKKYTRIMTDEMFYFYHIVHMAKHLISGGCGIKNILDFWVLENRVPADFTAREKIISESGFLAFEEGVRRLSHIWFDGAPSDEVSETLGAFIITGGVYGTVQNGVSIGVVKKQGRLRYALSRIFLPYSTMKNLYPTLRKHKNLLPFFHIRRWIRVIFKGGLKRAKAQFSKSGRISETEIKDTAKILEYLGLDV